MKHHLPIGFSRHEGFITISLPYDEEDLQFVIFMPDRVDGLAELARKLNPKLLEECSFLQRRSVILYMPKFLIESSPMLLSKELMRLGMKTAFDIPQGSANFEGIAPRRTNDYLAISEIYHKTFLNLDEYGTEAAAATAVSSRVGSSWHFTPEEIFVEKPFFFAIQHIMSKACLFLGYLADPRHHG